ncbi:MAG: dihydrolipoyl dehydrogenase [Alphaproteobacteria bacterium CG_4_10_14_0_8_um_filter_53_9]|nr:MAG: dihydrolipoyl dehydrogenase [Alphaproteobacteria bacterium CG_4_10_14_0_8_um_filter_53_9]
MNKKQFDVVVLGSGPGGYVAAIRAAQLGLSVGIVEKAELGGVCLNWGCIPTKALLRAAEMKTFAEHSAEFGLDIEVKGFDFTKVVGRSRDVAGKLSGGIGFLMKKNKIEVVRGWGRFAGTRVLEVLDEAGAVAAEVSFGACIVATGARARQIPTVLEASEHVWTAREAMVPKELPKSLLVVGAGAIGVEFASFYNAFGTKVTIVEMQDRVVPVEDAEISKALGRALEKQGIEILTGASVSGVKSAGAGAEAVVNGEVRTFDKALIAIGVAGNVEGIGLEALAAHAKLAGGVEALVERGVVKVNKATYATKVDGVYAIGDVIGAPWLAHVASHEGVICAEAIAYKLGRYDHAPHAMDYGNIPGCTYCTPQVASTGMTEAAALVAGHEVKVGRFNYQANGKALAMGEADGFVKTVFDAETGALLGAHMIGAEATEMISTFVLGRSMEAVEEDFYRTCLPHPTLSEMLGEAVLDADGRSLNS